MREIKPIIYELQKELAYIESKIDKLESELIPYKIQHTKVRELFIKELGNYD